MSEIEEHAAEHERMTPTERHGRYEALLAGDVLPNELEAEGFVDAWGKPWAHPSSSSRQPLWCRRSVTHSG